MEEKQDLTQKSHKLSMNNRRTALLTGINDVLSFDPNEVLLDTVQGTLMIRGEDLHVSRLSIEKGEVDIDGKINSFSYTDSNGFVKNGETLFSRLFK
ncbi:MAG: sporulation protein YabP [bacterium]|nr:sporulation protein YabP [bacterium]